MLFHIGRVGSVSSVCVTTAIWGSRHVQESVVPLDFTYTWQGLRYLSYFTCKEASIDG